MKKKLIIIGIILALLSAFGAIKINSIKSREKSMTIMTVEANKYVEILVSYYDDKINVLEDSGKALSDEFIKQKNIEIKFILLKIFEQSKGNEEKIEKLKSETNLLEKLRYLNLNNAFVLKVRKDFVNEVIDELKNDPNIEHAQPNFRYYPDELRISEPFNTDLLQNQWNLESDYGIHAYEAWEELQGYANVEDVTVAVIDSGTQTNHPELDDVLWNGNTYHGAVYDFSWSSFINCFICLPQTKNIQSNNDYDILTS